MSRETMAVWGVSLMAAAAPLAIFAPLGEVPLAIVAGLLVAPHLASAWRPDLRAITRHPATWVAALFFAWMAAASFWSPDVGRGLALVARLLGGTVLGLMLVGASRRAGEASRDRLERAVLVGVGLAAALMFFDLASHMWLSRLLRGDHLPYEAYTEARLKPAAVVLVLFLWPAVTGLRARFGLFAALAALAAAAALGLAVGSGASALAIASGVAAGGLAAVARRRAIAMAGVAAICLAIIFGPAALSQAVPTEALDTTGPVSGLLRSSESRLGIWSFAGDLARQRPLTGYGMDASRTIGADPTNVHPFRRIPLHPHNVPLQIMLELGLPGLMLWLALMGLLLAAALRLATWPRFIAVGAITAGLMVNSVSFGAWQNWWHAAMWMVAAFLLPQLLEPTARSAEQRRHRLENQPQVQAQ